MVHIKNTRAKLQPLSPAEKDPRAQCSPPLGAFVLMLYKHRHITPWGQVHVNHISVKARRVHSPSFLQGDEAAPTDALLSASQ